MTPSLLKLLLQRSTSFWRRRRRSRRRVATGRCLSGHSGRDPHRGRRHSLARHRGRGAIPLRNDDRCAACRELGRGLVSCTEDGGDRGPAPPLSPLGRRRLSPRAARWIQGREGGNAARGRAAWMVKGSGDRRLWRRLARAPEAGAGRPAGPIFRPGGRRAAQSHQVRPKEAQEPSAGTVEGLRLNVSRHQRPIR